MKVRCCTRCRENVAEVEHPGEGRMIRTRLRWRVFRWQNTFRETRALRIDWCQRCSASFRQWHDDGAHR